LLLLCAGACGSTKTATAVRGVTGRTAGLDWADIAVTPGLAYGVESGDRGDDDSTALLTGNWGPDQVAEGTEVELRLRRSLSPHRATGYEINFRCSKTSNACAEIVRWNGPLGKFSYLTGSPASRFFSRDLH